MLHLLAYCCLAGWLFEAEMKVKKARRRRGRWRRLNCKCFLSFILFVLAHRYLRVLEFAVIFVFCTRASKVATVNRRRGLGCGRSLFLLFRLARCNFKPSFFNFKMKKALPNKMAGAFLPSFSFASFAFFSTVFRLLRCGFTLKSSWTDVSSLPLSSGHHHHFLLSFSL